LMTGKSTTKRKTTSQKKRKKGKEAPGVYVFAAVDLAERED